MRALLLIFGFILLIVFQHKKQSAIAPQTEKWNSIDNQRVNPQNIGNDRKETGKTRNKPEIRNRPYMNPSTKHPYSPHPVNLEKLKILIQIKQHKNRKME